MPLADEETGLGTARLNGELDRTAFQLRRFGDIAERGVPFEATDDLFSDRRERPCGRFMLVASLRSR